MMLRDFFFGRSEPKVIPKVEPVVPEISDDQPRNRYNEIFILSGHTEFVDSIVKIDNERVLTTGHDKKGIIWDTKSGKVLHVLEGHLKPITCSATLGSELYYTDETDHDVNIDEDPVILVTASSDHTLRVWDLMSGKCLKVTQEHNSTVKCMSLTKDREEPLVVTGGQDICLWSHSFQLLSKFQRNSLDYVHSVICIKDNKIVAASDKPELMVYKVAMEDSEGEQRRTIELFKKLPPHRESITCLTPISDAMFASSSMDGDIICWTTHRLSPTRKFNHYEVFMDYADHTYPYAVPFFMVVDQRYLFAATGTGFAIFDTISDTCLMRKTYSHYAQVTCMALLDNDRILATSSSDGTIRLWASPLPLTTAEAVEANEASCSVSRLFGKRVRDMRFKALQLDLVGICYGHGNSVKQIVSCNREGFVSCGTDGLIILWKDAVEQDKREDELMRNIIEQTGWTEH